MKPNMKTTILVTMSLVFLAILTYSYVMSYEQEFRIQQVEAKNLSYENVATKSPVILEDFNEDPVRYLQQMFLFYKVAEDNMSKLTFQVRSNYILILPHEEMTIKVVHPSQLPTPPSLFHKSTMYDDVEELTHVDVIVNEGFGLMVPCWWVVSCPTQCRMFSINSYPMLFTNLVVSALS